MEKVYCIVKKQGDIYFPIKAKLGPYKNRWGREKVSYLAGMPNFFGGTVDADVDINRFSTLIRELAEESQDNIELGVSTDWAPEDRARLKREAMESTCQKLFEFTTSDEPETDYYFYLFDADQYEREARAAVTITGFVGNIAALSTVASEEGGDEGRREMSCIFKVPVNRCTNIDVFLRVCEEINRGHDYMKSLDEITVRGSQWHDVGTKNAFMAFCEKRAELMR